MSLRSSLNNVLDIWPGHANARQVSDFFRTPFREELHAKWPGHADDARQVSGSLEHLCRKNSMPNDSAMLMRGFSRTPLAEELHTKWLGHADARQVSDLPSSDTEFQAVSDRQVDIQRIVLKAVGDRLNLRGTVRQVEDLPRISMAEPFGAWFVLLVVFQTTRRVAAHQHERAIWQAVRSTSGVPNGLAAHQHGRAIWKPVRSTIDFMSRRGRNAA
jgi:hypothetical protein